MFLVGKHKTSLSTSIRRFNTLFHRLSEIELDNQKVNVEQYKTFKPTLVYSYNKQEIDVEKKQTKKMNLCTALNDAMKIAMDENEKTLIFGEDVAFGGVFRCTVDLLEKFGKGL